MEADQRKHSWTIRFDGGALPNPGIGTCAFIAINEDGESIQDKWKMGGIRTNNEAEWDAVVTGIERVIEHDNNAILITVVGDSELVINQMRGSWNVKDPKLREFHKRFMKVKKERGDFLHFTYHHVPRRFNYEMDQACKDARNLEAST